MSIGNAGGNNPADEFTGFEYGDVVEHRMNTNVFGVVVGFQGSLVGVRVSPSLAVLWFHEFELQPEGIDDYEPDEPQQADNVIDFTRAVDLRRAKTKGAA